MSYPANCIRGIRSRQDFHDDGLVGPSAFKFEGNAQRQDDLMEASINWEDDSSVIEFTMNQKKGETGEFEFKAGIAVVSIGRMHAILPDFLATGQLAYERRQVVGNPYHGNILLKASVDSRTKKLIIAGICLAVVGSNQR